MPHIRADAVAFGVLLLCVPLQYILVKYWGRTEIGRTHALKEFMNNVVAFRSSYLEWDSWRRWCISLISNAEQEDPDYLSMYSSDPNDPMGESPAIEIMKFKQKEGHFALSPEPRIYRSPDMQFRVGQIVSHKFWKYRGVVIGWDESAKAPSEWLVEMNTPDKRKLLKMPNYSVLVDVRDRLNPQVSYVPQDNLVPIKSTRIIHPLLDEHFEDYDGNQYIPRPWLRALYPKD